MRGYQRKSSGGGFSVGQASSSLRGNKTPGLVGILDANIIGRRRNSNGKRNLFLSSSGKEKENRRSDQNSLRLFIRGEEEGGRFAHTKPHERSNTEERTQKGGREGKIVRTSEEKELKGVAKTP